MNILKTILFLSLLGSCSSTLKKSSSMILDNAEFILLDEQVENENLKRSTFYSQEKKIKILRTQLSHASANEADKYFFNRRLYIKKSYEKVSNPYIETKWSEFCLKNVKLDWDISQYYPVEVQRFDVLFSEDDKVYLCDHEKMEYVSGTILLVREKKTTWEIRIVGANLDFYRSMLNN